MECDDLARLRSHRTGGVSICHIPRISCTTIPRYKADEYRYRAPLLDWWATLTDGFRKSRLVIEKEPQTLAEVKSWLHHSVGPLLAVVLEQPDGYESLQRIAKAGKRRWKTKHHRLLQLPGQNGEPAEARPIKLNGSS